MSRFLLFLFVILFFSNCKEKIKYTFFDYHTFENNTWNSEEKITFEFNIKDSISNFSKEIHIRHNSDYKYQNILLFVHQTSPDNRTNIDTINILLSDKISGKWIGKGETDIREHLFVLKDKTKLKKGTHLLVFEIAMRYGDIIELKSISNISEIGFSVKKL